MEITMIDNDDAIAYWQQNSLEENLKLLNLIREWEN